MLTHANIVQIYDFVKMDETYLLAMEFVDGKNLRQSVNKARRSGAQLSIELALYVMNEVCKGLDYAHSKKDDLSGRPLNIIHRDMSPQNVMLSYDGSVKIVDFGIAKAKDRVDETRSGVIKGKFSYMSPEQANGMPVDHRSDIFSTAIILYELLTGRRLFAAENDLATLKLIQECAIPKPSRINPKISTELERLILKGLTKEVDHRFQTAGQFHRQLQEHLNKYFPTFTQSEVGEFMHKIFVHDIEKEKKAYEEVHRQSIPFSQGTQSKAVREFNLQEPSVEGSITRTDENEKEEDTVVSQVGDDSKGSQSSGQQQSLEVAASESTVIADSSSVDGLASLSLIPVSPSDSKRTGLSQSTEANSKVESSRADESKAPSKQQPGDSLEGLIQDEGSLDKLAIELKTIPQTPRQRERSISALKQSQNPPDSSLAPLKNIEIESLHKGPKKPEKKSKYSGANDYQHERESYRSMGPSRRSTPALFVVVGIGVLVGMYRLYQSGEVPTIIETVNSRIPTTVPSVKIPTPTVGLAHGDCVLNLESDPSGASFLINGQVRGVTSGSIAVPCGKAVSVTFKKDGYDTLSENIIPNQKDTRVAKSLVAIPVGVLELMVNRNLAVYIDDEYSGEIKANQLFSIPLRANRTHRVRFKNEIYGIDMVREFPIQEGLVHRKTMTIEDNNSEKKRKKIR